MHISTSYVNNILYYNETIYFKKYDRKNIYYLKLIILTKIMNIMNMEISIKDFVQK